MTTDAARLRRELAGGGPAGASRRLAAGEDCCFLTLGDALLYSTYIYLLRELRAIGPAVTIVTVPGVTAFSAAAALTNFPVGQGKQPVTIVPASDDLDAIRPALDRGGTVVLMKIGRRLQQVLDDWSAAGLIGPGRVRFSCRHGASSGSRPTCGGCGPRRRRPDTFP